ncbi:MAG TPA: FG-GAP-like repeat-containing protein [Usitatibacteraceae bacterium]
MANSKKLLCIAAGAVLAISAGVSFAQVGTAGSGSVSPSGAFTYSIPVRLPPGTAGVQPSIALSYNSQGGNGNAGVGWTLGGVSSISRCASSPATDAGVRGNVNLDANDKLCLDGQRLIVQSGTYGQPNAVYVTEIFNGSRITQIGSTPTLGWRTPSASYTNYPTSLTFATASAGSGTPISSQGVQKTTYATSASDIEFRVETKAGELMEYARADLYSGGSTQPTAMWLLVRVLDSHGNYWTIDYARDNANNNYMTSAINYTGNAVTGLAPYNKVEFVYETRSDVGIGYVGGLRLASNKRLTTVRTWASPSGGTTQQAVTEYRLSYTASPATQRSVLQSVQEFGKDGAGNWIGLNPITFAPNTPAADFSAFNGSGTGNWTGPGVAAMHVVTGDFNGDGRTDFAAWTSVGDQWQICQSTGSGFTCSYWNGPGVDAPNVITGDFNGDGKTDFAAYTGSNGLWQICLAGDTNFICSNWAGPGVTRDHVVSGDFNGDGRTDFAAYTSNGDLWQICQSTGSNFSCSYWNGIAGTAFTYRTVHGVTVPAVISADFNGDGKMDLAAYTGANGIWTICLAGETNFSCSNWTGPGVNRDQVAIGDFNGDGKADLLAYTGNSDIWQVCQSTGSNFACSYWNGPANHPASDLVSGDFNGDGKTDIAVWAGSSNGDLWIVCLAGSVNFNCYNSHGFTLTPPDIVLGDFNGDGTQDMAGYTGANGVWDIRMAPVNSPDLLASVTTSLGMKSDINYAPLSSAAGAGRYSREYSLAYPRVVLTPNIPAVLTITSDNAVGGRNAVNYWYANAVYSHDGRSSQGFGWQQSQDAITGLVNRTWFATDWPYTGSPQTVMSWTNAGSKLSRSDVTYGSFQVTNSAALCSGACTGGLACMVYSASSLSKTWDLDGSALPQSRSTTSNVDCYGNPGTITSEILTGSPWNESVFDAAVNPGAATGYSKTTTNEYVNDPGANWWIGRLKKSVVTSNKPAN